MRPILLVIAASLLAPISATITAQQSEIVVRGVAARVEIERILNADNLNTATLGSRFVADLIAGISRGRAPTDFWTAYQAHVRAWRQLADAEDQAKRALEDVASSGDTASLVVEAERQIETTFDEVERIALAYGARMPVPPQEIVPTT